MGRSRVRVKRIDRGWKKIRKNLKSQRMVITVGIQGKEARIKSGDEGDDLTNADVGAINELGMGVPERSFLRSTIDAGRRKYLKLLNGIGDASVAGKISLVRGAKIVGEVVVGDIKEAISGGIPPPNAESTIKQKGSSTPLIDKGQLRGSITSKVEAHKSLGGKR